MIFGQSQNLTFESAISFPHRGIGRRYMGVRSLLICLMVVFLCTASLAGEVGTYQVVPGNDDNAYLVDTATGAVWVLTYRALATGREPIAIPYKFIKLSPQSHKDFLVVDVPGAGVNVRKRD
jgi:hypothetical protein